MIKRTVIDMTRLNQLQDQGYSADKIAKILNIPFETVRTIMGGVGHAHASHDPRGNPLRKCA